MTIALSQIGQVSLSVDNIDTAEKFYGEGLGLRKLYRFGNLTFFDCSGVRLFIEATETKPLPKSSVLYFRTPDITVSMRELKSRGISFIEGPSLIAPMEDHDLWMAFFTDPAGNTLALMQEAPKGYKPN